ncbi:Coiled-coil domain-containing protein 112 [Plecturocebus cupreus]
MQSTLLKKSRVPYQEKLTHRLWVIQKQKAFRAISSKIAVDKITPSTLPEEVPDFEKFLQQTGG